MKLKKTISGVLAVTTLLLGSLSTLGNASAFSVETKDTPVISGAAAPETSGDAAAYGLCDNINDGIILHAWCWSFNTIKNNMADIAAAGYTAVQTSPASECYDKYPNLKLMGTDTKDGTDGCWWWQYQPTALTVGNYQLGTEADYQAMCAEADKYGIKIITDIVANHTTSHHKDNDSGVEDSTKDYDADAYATAVGGFGNLYHETDKYNRRAREDNPIRFEFINYRCGGLPDINTENTAYQSYLLTYLNKLISLGCDGFRFDTAKQIGVRSWEGTYTDPVIDKYNGGNGGSVTYDLTYNFWPVVTGKANVAGTSNRLNKPDDFYFYGEILGNDEKSDIINAYADYIDVTASAYGDNLRTYVQDKDLSAIAVSNWNHKLTSDHLVTWVESHDSYCNDHDSAGLTDWQLRMAWAVVAARDGGTPLFFNRPDGSDGSSGNYWGNNELGAKGNDQFKDAEVTAVNKFHNAMVGEPETLRNINGNNQILQIDRGRNGTCIINLSSNSVTINTETTMADGTYTDTVSGRTFNVSDGKISGTLDSGKIATIYKPTMMRLSASSGDRVFTGTSIDVALNISNAQSTGSYTLTVDGTTSSEQSFSDGTILTIGSDINVSGGSKDIVLTLKATDNNSNVITKEYIYTKKNLSKDPVYVYFDNSTANKLNLKAYIYNDSGAYSAWSGESMTHDTESGYYRLQMPTDYINGYVIFNGTSYQYPASEYPGLKLHGVSMLYNPSDNSWTEYYVTEDENDIPDSDSDLSTYRYTYFFNSLAWTGTATAELSDDSGNTRTISLKNSDDLHCYYVKYPVEDGYTKITFNVGSNSTTEQTINPGMVFVPTNKYNNQDTVFIGEWISIDNIVEHTIYFSHLTSAFKDHCNIYLWREIEDDVEFKNAEFNIISMTPLDKDYNSGYFNYSFSYYYPKISSIKDENSKVIDDYQHVVFSETLSSTTKQTVDGDIAEDVMAHYFATTTVNGGGKDNKDHYYINEEELDPKAITIEIAYANEKAPTMTDTDTVTSENKTTQLADKVSVTNSDYSSVVKTACEDMSMTNVYDTYTFHSASQFDYVKSLASETDSYVNTTLPRAAYTNPASFAHPTTSFGGANVTAADKLKRYNNPANGGEWVEFYSGTTKVETDNVYTNLGNVDKIKVWAVSMPRTYTVNFDINGTTYTENCSYNQLLSATTQNNIKTAIENSNQTFDGWYIKDGTKELKITSEPDYKYRITQGRTLYARFRTTDRPAHKATAIADPIDVFSENKTTMYRYNTLLNICDLGDSDSNITDVGIVYVKLDNGQTYSMDTIKTNILNNVVGKNGVKSIALDKTGNNTANIKYNQYSVENNQVQLTTKNRLQFNLKLTETQATTGNYKNVLAFTVYNYNGTWHVSENCVHYTGSTFTEIE